MGGMDRFEKTVAALWAFLLIVIACAFLTTACEPMEDMTTPDASGIPAQDLPWANVQGKRLQSPDAGRD
jgi:hypothetical protein